MSKSDAAVYLMAAESVKRKGVAAAVVICPLCDYRARPSDAKASDNFVQIFGDGERYFDVVPGMDFPNISILALCFAAAMAETGDL